MNVLQINASEKLKTRKLLLFTCGNCHLDAPVVFADICLTCFKITQKRLHMTRYGIIDYVMSNFFPFMAKPDLTIFFFRSWHLEQIENKCP